MLLATGYFLAGMISGIVALWHGPTLRALRGQCLLAVAAVATVAGWVFATEVPPLPDFVRPGMYRYLVRLHAPAVIAALMAPLAWQQLAAAQTQAAPEASSSMPD